MGKGQSPKEWVNDVSPAAWIGPRLHPFGRDVGSVIPEGFEAYSRLFHPVELGRGREQWAEVARRNRRLVHPEMQFHWVSCPRGQKPPEGYHPGDGPSWGSLPLEESRALVDILRRHTTTRETCWFCVWEGYSSLYDGGEVAWHRADVGRQLLRRPRRRQGRPSPAWASAPRVELPHRKYFLYRGPIETPTKPLPVNQSPNLWWPDDRAWFVVTEVDYAWTYVGGSRAAIDAVLYDSRLEVLPSQLTHKPFYDSDLLNPALEAG